MGFFQLSFREVVWDWLLPMRSFLWRAALVGLALWYASYSFPPLVRLLLHGSISSTLVLFLLARYGVPRSFQEELLQRAPTRASRALSWLFGAPKFVAQAKLT